MTINRIAIRILLFTCIFFAALVIAYVSVEHVLPSVLTNKYKHQINQAFDQYFTPELSADIKDMGIALPQPQPATCDNGPYSPSSPCTKDSYVNLLQFNTAMAIKWDKYSKQLDDYLSEHNWQLQTGDRYNNFAQLPHDHSNAYQVFATYSKNNNGVMCALSASYDKSVPYGTVYIDEGCSKFSKSPSEWLSRIDQPY